MSKNNAIEFQELGEDPRGSHEPTYEFRSNKLNIEEMDADHNDTRRMNKKQAERYRQLNSNLRLSFIADVANDNMEEEKLWKDFFWYVPFLLLFIFFLLAQRDTEGYYWNHQAVGNKAANEEFTFPYWGKKFLDIANQPDWGDWVSQVLVPLYWSEDFDSAATNVIMGNNIKVGSVRVRTVRMENNSCSLNTQVMNTSEALFPDVCYSAYKIGYQDWEVDQYGDYPAKACKSPSIMKVEGKIQNWNCGGNILDVPFNETKKDATKEITNQAVTDYFADQVRSRFVMVEFMHYNPTLNIFSLSQNWVEISAGGAFLPQTRTIFFEVMTSSQKGAQAYTVIFFLAVIVVFARFWIQLFTACKKNEAGRFIFSVWNILEFLNLIIFIVMLSFRFAWWKKCVDLDYKLPNDGAAPFNEDLHFVAALYDMTIFLNGVNTVIMFLKILKFAPLNRRLRIVTRSVVRAQQNIVGLMILFVVVLLAFSITGMSLFGTGLEDFRNLEVAFSTLMRILLGDFAYDDLREENLFLAGIFFWAYLILGLFLLLNFIIAVIGNAFGQENADLIAEPMDKQIEQFFGNIKRTLTRVVSNPSRFCGDIVRNREEEWAKEGKYELICNELKAYRKSLPIEGISAEDYEELPDHEREEFMPDPFVVRSSVNDVFNARPDGGEKLKYLTELFVDDFWIVCVQEQHLHDNHKNKAIIRRKKLMADCAEKQLRGVLGLGGGEAIAEPMSVRELLEPSEQSLAHLAVLEDRVKKIEAITNNLGDTFCKLNTMIVAATDNKNGSKAEEEEVPEVDMLPLQVPKTKLAPPTMLGL